ncbi:SET domain-containing protein [Nocardia brasiliensis]|uniref:SET domain-containing protein n=1 Tax=Nocardia brasiliensis TaxID=37326 RepID=UPI002453D565|nr:SET domain-containing protein [Nocardia brasiliensis]
MSYTNSEIVTEELLADGEKGLLAKTDIRAGAVIGVSDGEIRKFTISGGKLVQHDMHKYTVQVHRAGNVLYGLVGRPPDAFSGIDYINHSCSPNLIVRDRIVVLAERWIAAGERLTLDYRTWDFVPEGRSCWCKVRACTI